MRGEKSELGVKSDFQKERGGSKGKLNLTKTIEVSYFIFFFLGHGVKLYL